MSSTASHASVSLALVVAASGAWADSGIAASGSSGGLVVPSARVLGVGELAASIGSYEEPQLGLSPKRRNFSLGVGLFPRVEFFGRFAEYQNPIPGSTFVNGGPRDLSANIKVQLPTFWKSQPKLAVGINDLSGGASFFKSKYAVASDDWGPFDWTLGYAKRNSVSNSPLDGLFGGLQYRLGQTGASVLLERDGQQKQMGLRYESRGFDSLGGARLIATLQRSSGARDATGRSVDASSAGLSVVVPLGQTEARRSEFKVEKPLPGLDAKASASMQPTGQDRQEALLRALVAAGLERVRVGVLGNSLMIEYENHRYGQSEADALGIVLGLAAEFVPTEVRRVSAITLKSGQRVYESSVDVAVYRAYLRDGDAAQARTSLAVDRAPTYDVREVKWIKAAPERHSVLRVEVRPDVAYHIGTEVAAFDYSLAAAFQATLPVWEGGDVVATYVQHLANSQYYDPGLVWSNERQRNGLKSLTLQQSYWLGSHVYATAGIGRYNYGDFGVQGEASVFVPGREDVIRLRAAVYDKPPSSTTPQKVQVAASYRWVPVAGTWVEAGFQQYGDGTRGPSLVMTRWYGDVGVHVHYRRGGTTQFAGLDLSIPLTPRQGMEPGLFQVTGASQFQRGVRTQILNTLNYVQTDAARDIQLDYNAEVDRLNSGRMSQRYFITQLSRMREAFYLYGRALLPQ